MDKANNIMSNRSRKIMLERRASIPGELEDHDDVRVGDGQAHHFETPRQNSDHQDLRRKMEHHLPKEARNLIAGGIAGMTAKSVVAPLDRIKILFQVSSAEFSIFRIPLVARTIVQTEGLAALWKGNTATMIRVFPYSGIQFMVFDRIKTHFLQQHQLNPTRGPRNRHGLTPLESLAGGMVAGSVSVICTYPLDLTRTQLAVLKKQRHAFASGVAPPPDHGFMSVMADNYSRRGVPGLFRGITPTMLGILPYAGIAFTLNEQSKRQIQHVYRRDLTTLEKMICGAFAGLVAQTVTYPIEVIRRRMQTLGLVGNETALTYLGGKAAKPAASPSSVPTSATHPPTLTHLVRALYAEQGVRGFFKGVSVNWMKGPIAFSISFTTFDIVQGLMESKEERKQRLLRRFTMVPQKSSSKV